MIYDDILRDYWKRMYWRHSKAKIPIANIVWPSQQQLSSCFNFLPSFLRVLQDDVHTFSVKYLHRQVTAVVEVWQNATIVVRSPPIYNSTRSPTSYCYNAKERHTTLTVGPSLNVPFPSPIILHFNHLYTDYFTNLPNCRTRFCGSR